MTKGRLLCARHVVGPLVLTATALAPFAADEKEPSVFERAEPVVLSTARQTATTTVWDRVFTEEQATRGQQSYQDNCEACHLESLVGDGYAAALVAEDFSIRWSGLSVDDLFTAIATAMPPGDPGGLSFQAYIDIVSYVLKVNDIPAGDTELPTDTEMLKQILITAKPEG